MVHKHELLSSLELSQCFSTYSLGEADLGRIECWLKDNEIDTTSFLNRKKGDQDETLLHYYARSPKLPNDEKICQLLVKYGADVNCIDKSQSTPLHRAVGSSKIDITVLLLDHGAYVNAQDDFKNTPLLIASTKNGSLCDLLLRHGADPNIKNILYETPILRAVQVVNNALSRGKEIVNLLLHHGGDVEIRDVNQKSAIEIASALGYEDIFDWCTQNAQNSSGKRLVLIHVPTEICKLLLKPD